MVHWRSIVIALLLATSAGAEIKTQTVPAGAGADATFSMSTTALDAPATIAAFVKQTGINVTYDGNGGMPFGGPDVVYDVDFKNLSRDEAIKEVARALSLGIMRTGDSSPPRLSSNGWSGESERRAEKMVELGYLTRDQSFPASPNRPNNLNLQFRIWSGKRPLDGPVRVQLDEAKDEQGRNLLTTDRQPRFYDNSENERYVSDTTLVLQFPDPAPKKIATLKGNGIIARPKTILRLTADGLDKGKQTGELNGATISIGPMKPNGPRIELPIVIGRGKLTNDAWQGVQNRVNQLRRSAIVKGPNGELLRLEANGWGSDGRKLTIESSVYTPDANGNMSGSVPQISPATIQWDTVIETTDELLPFSMTNIDIP